MHAFGFMNEARRICGEIDTGEVERMATALAAVTGRVYMVGLGGSLANCMHMAADLRKLCLIDAVAPDNLSELTAWANDEGWECMFHGFLESMNDKDALFVLSVGGGTQHVSKPIAAALAIAVDRKTKVFGILGPDGGLTAKVGQHVVRIPVENHKHVTPHTEAFQAVLWHLLVSHPLLQKRKTKW